MFSRVSRCRSKLVDGSDHRLGRAVVDHDAPVLNLLPDEVVPHVYVSGSLLIRIILLQENRPLVVLIDDNKLIVDQI
jgi:hypothetical protein